jgi:hypothetical protein
MSMIDGAMPGLAPSFAPSNSTRKKVLCPIKKGEKTIWVRLGTAFINRDNSINVYLDGLPTNGKLQLRDWDEPGRGPRDGDGGDSSDGNSAELPF